MREAMQNPELLAQVRALVRDRLLACPSYLALSPEKRHAIAHDTVKTIAYIVGGPDGTVRPASAEFAGDSPVARALADKPPLPEGETAGQRFAQSGAVAAQQGGEALADLVSRVNFPKFVAGLIDGVFNAIVASSIKQMEAYAELVANVAKSVDQYMKDNVTENNARDYLADRYPNLLEVDFAEKGPQLKVREGVDEGSLPDFQADLGTAEKVDSLDDPTAEEKLVPAARRRIALDRQQLLATMVMMGVNRLVVTNGVLEASCLFELDTRDEVRRRMQQKRTADWASQREGSWGAEGSYSRSGSGFLGLGDDTESKSSWFSKGGYRDTSNFNVSTTRSEDSTAKVDLHAKLSGKVNLTFKSDYFPMEKMVDTMQVNQIRAKTPAAKGAEGAPPPGGAEQPAAAPPAPPARP